MATMFEVSGIGDSRMPARIPLPAGNAIRVILSADKHDLSVTISRTTVRICAVTWRLEPETEMPARPQWLLRVPDILAELSALEVPVVDRSIIESAFRVKRRRAIYLLGWFGGYQVGRTFLVERDSLLRQLRQIAAGERFDYEKRRHERLTESLARVRRELQAANVVIPVPEQTPQPAGLPDGVTLETGRLLVEFSSVEDLLGKLYGIAQAAAGDFAAFEAAAGGASHRLAVEIP
ncbi:MAG TPA: hypothetical protein VN442_26475 [Bryobacteraceae bacterium]|nr:hypothetical protein [Bryobacteraceae bacterium]